MKIFIAFFLTNAIIYGSLTIVIKLYLKDKGLDVTFLYAGISDIKNFGKYKRESISNSIIYYVYIMSLVFTIGSILMLILVNVFQYKYF